MVLEAINDTSTGRQQHGNSQKDSSELQISERNTHLRSFQSDLTLRKQWVDELGHSHALLDQKLHGLPVVGGEVRVHFGPDGDLQALSGITRKDAHRQLSATPKLNGAAAQSRAAERTNARNKATANARLVFLHSTKTGDVVLAWEVKVTGDTPFMPLSDLVYVDAETGEEIERHAQIHSALNRQIYDANQSFSWGTIARSEGGGASGDSDVNVNYDFMGTVYNYFKSVHGRDSYNNAGATILSTVDWGYGVNANNAFWNGDYNRFAFGDGDGNTFTHFTLSRDVVAHEFTHAVTQYTSGLVYSYESGAVNEAMSDILGAMADAWARGGGTPVVDANTWKLAEDIFTPAIAGDAGRYMDNPTADGWSYDWYPSRYTGSDDNGGVHWNSGIANLAFKLAVTGGRHPRYTTVAQPLYVPALGAVVAQKIFYRANTVYLSSTSNFAGLRAATAKAAQDLANAGQAPGNAAQIIHLAWDAVGVSYVSGNSRPINISTRADVGTGNDIAIAGFVLGGGSNPHSLLLRGIGPALAQFGVSNYLSNPTMTLYAGSNAIASNDNWYQASNASSIASTGSAVGAFPLPNPSLDSAILQSFSPGTYTVHMSGVNGGTGNGMLEVYATDYNNANHLTNISTRCLVTASPAIAGFVVNGEGYKRLLIRAVGPTLSSFGVPSPVSNPKLTLFVGGTTIRENDDWSTESNAGQIASTAQAIGAFALPSGSKDAAILIDLPPGTYTAHMNGVNGVTGIGLIEVYEVN